MTNDLHIGARVSWPVCRYTLGRSHIITLTGVVESFGVGGWVWVLPDGRAASVPVQRAQLTVLLSEERA
jgi:hypothetical protein